MVKTKNSTARQLNGDGIDLEMTDLTGQRRIRIEGYDREARVRDLVRDVVDRMGLSATDSAGTPVVYRGRLKRESRHLHESEVVGEALQSDDVVMLLPNIDAGAGV